jgi:hypothetical protein
MHVRRLRYRDLRADTVGGAGQHRFTPAIQLELEQAGEPTDRAQHLRAAGPLSVWPQRGDGLLTGEDVHSGRGVGGV